MAYYAMQVFGPDGRLIFDSERRVLKLQGVAVVRGVGAQPIIVKQHEIPFFMAMPYNSNIASGRMVELSYDANNSVVRYNSISDNEYLLYYGTY